MIGNIRIDASGLDLSRLEAALDEGAPVGLAQGMEHIRGVSAEQTPIESGRLVGSGTVEVDGDEASLSYEGPYARYQHYRLDLRHEHGNALYLEKPLIEEKDTALGIVAEAIRDAL